MRTPDGITGRERLPLSYPDDLEARWARWAREKSTWDLAVVSVGEREGTDVALRVVKSGRGSWHQAVGSQGE